MYLIFHKKMSFSEERQRLECGDDDMPVIDYIHYVHTSTLDEHLADEVVLDVHYVPKQSNNKNKINLMTHSHHWIFPNIAKAVTTIWESTRESTKPDKIDQMNTAENPKPTKEREKETQVEPQRNHRWFQSTSPPPFSREAAESPQIAPWWS